MKNRLSFFLVAAFLLNIGACKTVKKAQIGVKEFFDPAEHTEINGHEVYCAKGRVCSEVKVLNVSAENKKLGKISVRLKNQTSDTALVQIKFELYAKDSDILLDETRPENISIPAKQEKLYQMDHISQPNAKIKVFLNTAY